MAKSLFLLICSVLSVVMSPMVLTAADSVDVTGVSDVKAVETVALTKEEVISGAVSKPKRTGAVLAKSEDEVALEEAIKVEENAAKKVSPVVAAKAPVAGYVAAQPVKPNYTVTNYIGSISEYLATYTNLSYSAIYKYGKMIYGHNSYNLLGSLRSRTVGEVITITEGGVARDYRVAAVAMYEKTADGNLNGDPRLMTRIATSAMGHDLVLFTCAGTAYGNGDSSHRLAVYVDAV